LVDAFEIEASVEFSISARGGVGLCAEGANLGRGGGAILLISEAGFGSAALGAGEAEKEGSGLAGDETSGALKVDGSKGAGILGSGREIASPG
jgi:hypothetical protein